MWYKHKFNLSKSYSYISIMPKGFASFTGPLVITRAMFPRVALGGSKPNAKCGFIRRQMSGIMICWLHGFAASARSQRIPYTIHICRWLTESDVHLKKACSTNAWRSRLWIVLHLFVLINYAAKTEAHTGSTTTTTTVRIIRRGHYKR